MPQKKRICFVSMEVYPILKPGSAEIAGGAGFQLVQLGKGLQARGYSVAFVVGDYGQAKHEVIDGFDVVDAIVNSKRDGGDNPIDPVKIESMTVVAREEA